MATTSPAAALDEGLAGLGLALPVAARETLVAYVALLARWNRAYNLTAVREPLDMVRRHLLDSLAVLPYICGSSLLDVGSGAGLPGIPLAVARPDLRCVLLDGNGKKTRFCIQACAELGLGNVAVARTRVEDYRPAAPFATVVSRAFSELGAFLTSTRHLCAAGGCWLAMKGAVTAADRAAAGPSARVERLRVPGLDAERNLIIVARPIRPEDAPAGRGQRA